jgi:hypothetical protein
MTLVKGSFLLAWNLFNSNFSVLISSCNFDVEKYSLLTSARSCNNAGHLFWFTILAQHETNDVILYIHSVHKHRGNTFQRQNYKMRLKQRSLNWINSMQVKKIQVCEWLGPGYTTINSGKNAFNPYNSVTKFFFLHLFWKFTFEDTQYAHMMCVWVPNGVTIFQFRSDNHLSTLTFVIYRHPVTLFTRDADWHKLVTDLFYDFVGQIKEGLLCKFVSDLVQDIQQ